MLFKNARIYQLTGDVELPEIMEEGMLNHPARDCQALEMKSLGWVNPVDLDNSEFYVHEVMGCMMIAMAINKKVLPAAVIRKAVDDRVAEIEKQEGRTVRRKERTQIKEEIVIDLMPRAFQQTKVVHAYIDKKRKLIVINTASAPEAEDLLSLMRESLGSFKVRPVQTNLMPSSILTHWVRRFNTPAGIYMENEVNLVEVGSDGADKEKIAIKNINMDNEEVTTHINAGKVVEKMRLCYQENICATLDNDMTMRRLKFLDIIQEEIFDTEADDAAARFDADMAIMTRELGQMIDDLAKSFGGLVEHQTESPEPQKLTSGAQETTTEVTRETSGDTYPPEGDDDPLYGQAVEMVRDSGKPFPSYLQRHLKVGYNRSCRLLERMEEDGIVSVMNGSGQRQVLQGAHA